MAGHFPFSGNGGRASTTAFFERYGFNDELQERYYKWWYDWAKSYVQKDKELSRTKALDFEHYPYGQHAHRGFHLNKKVWPVLLDDLGAMIKGTIFPRLSDEQMHKLEEQHHKALDEMKKAAKENPREPSPDIGYFRHV